MNEFLRKLTSRKLWVAIAGIATGVCLAMGAEATDISTVAGAMTAIISVASYIITEGRIDAEGVKNAVVEIEEAVDVIGGSE